MSHFYDTFPTPLGPFSVALHENGAVVATAFGDISDLRQRFSAETLVRDSDRAASVRNQVAAYFAGERTTFSLRLAPEGTPFQQRVWTALQAIPAGETTSYGELARTLGSGARAVGRANATNPICLLIPCHRVIGADGSLTGFAFGEDVKRRLLDHEGAALAAAT